jgi:phosphate starvation-inducible PhoH-like protein
MPRRSKRKDQESSNVPVPREFELQFLHPSQELAYRQFQRHDLLFLLGPAGTGKTHLATGFAIQEILQKKKERIVITRPVVESGESLGYLPGDFYEKIHPYMMPVYDCIDKIVGKGSTNSDKVRASLEVVPINYMRGRTFDSSVFILDEAQNCTYDQIKLAITRLGFNSKMIITGDPQQSDLPGTVALESVVAKISSLSGVATMRFKEGDVVRHSLIARILKRL